ncbi:MAG: hypothetical protein MJY55_00845 [Bacteroidales bacterium]|nr:hypothetical protein [Bacteroidales bacterium]
MKAEHFIITALCCLALFSCKKEDGTQGVADRVLLSAESIDMTIGESAVVTAKVLPESLGMGVTWEVMDTTIVSCDNGLITGKTLGVTYLVATSADGLAKSSCMVSVNNDSYPVTIIDEDGNALDGVYGYPGMSMTLTAVSGDEKAHTYTWSVEDETVATVDSEGLLSLGATESEEDEYVFFGESYIRVRSEDGCGTKIPVRSSILRGIKLDDTFVSVMPAIVEKSSKYNITAMYDGASLPEVIPGDEIELSLTDDVNFTLGKNLGQYTLETGSKMGVSTKLNVKTACTAEPVELARFKVDQILVIQASLKGATTSSLGFTWTEGVSAADDVSKAYTIALYKDSDCEEKVISLDIPADAECWEGKQPCFVFGGLESGKTYYFRANETGDLERMSNVVEAATGEFTNVAYDELTTPVVGDIILAENFNEWGYGTDETMGAAGFHDNDANLKIFSGDVDMNTVSLQKPSSTGRRFFHQTNLWDTGARIAQWGFAGNSSSYLRAGYLRMTTTSSGNRTHLVTPKLAAIPSGCLATIEVTARILRTEKDNQFGVLVQTGTMSKNSASSNPLPCYKLASLASDRKYPFDMTTANEWEIKTVTIDNITNSNSLAFGSIENVNGKNRFYIAEITVKLVDIKSASGFSASCSGKSSSTLAFKWTKGGSADADIANAYTAALYEDSACTQLNQSFDIPAGSSCWNNKQPCFVFGGLKPSTTYYLKVTDTTNNIESNVAGGTTEAFTVVAMPAEVTATGVVLAEDFGELRWDYERCFDAASFFPGSTDDFSNIANPTFRKVGDGSEKPFKSMGTALGKSRLNDWVQDSNVYLHPGCLKLGTSSARGWILTPEFTVPEGKKAVVKVTVTAARHDNNQDKDWTIVVLTPELAKASPSEHSADFGWPDVADPANCQTINITDYAVWNTLSVSGLEIHHGDRIAFGGVQGGSGSKGRVWISDITIEVTELK